MSEIIPASIYRQPKYTPPIAHRQGPPWLYQLYQTAQSLSKNAQKFLVFLLFTIALCLCQRYLLFFLPKTWHYETSSMPHHCRAITDRLIRTAIPLSRYPAYVQRSQILRDLKENFFQTSYFQLSRNTLLLLLIPLRIRVLLCYFGYSLSGLCNLFEIQTTCYFDQYLLVSLSTWFPDFVKPLIQAICV